MTRAHRLPNHFIGQLVFWAIVLLLAASPPGAIVGFVAGFGVAMFAGLLTPSLFFVLAGVGLATVLAFALWMLVRGFAAWRRGEIERACAWWSAAMPLVGVPAALWLCLRSLAANWP